MLKQILDETRRRTYGDGFLSYVKFYGTLFLGVVLVIAIGFGIAFKDKLKAYTDNMVYPKAQNMPVSVKVSLDDTLKQLQKAIDEKSPDLKKLMRPGLTKEQIAKLVDKYEMPLPEPMYKLYMWHDGSNLPSMGAVASDHRFATLEGAMSSLDKIRELNKALAKKNKLPETMYTSNLLSIYSNNSLALQYDLTRKPEEGAYVMSFFKPGFFCFFPSLRNALTAIAECYESGAFKVVESTSKTSIHDRNSIIADGKAWKLQVDGKKAVPILGKYGSFTKNK